jgi:hypothetical protein
MERCDQQRLLVPAHAPVAYPSSFILGGLRTHHTRESESDLDDVLI